MRTQVRAPNSDLGGQGKLSRGSTILAETGRNSGMCGRRQVQVFKCSWQGKQHMQRYVIKGEHDAFMKTKKNQDDCGIIGRRGE